MTAPDLPVAASPATQLAEQIVTRRAIAVETAVNKPNYEPGGFYPSSLGDCPRALFYSRALWPWRRPLPAKVQSRLEVGNWVHTQARRALEDLGLAVVAYEVPMTIDALDLRARIDLVCQITANGRPRKIVVEVKSMSDMAERSLRDLREKEYTRRYLRQMAAYLIGRGEREGLLLFVLIPSGLFVPQVVRLTAELESEVRGIIEPALHAWRRWAEDAQRPALVRQAHEARRAALDSQQDDADLPHIGDDRHLAQLERVATQHQTELEVRSLAETFAPPRIEYSEDVCGYCPWFSQCLPSTKGERGELQRWNDPELIGDVARWYEIAPRSKELASEVEWLKKRILEKLGNVKTAEVGPYLVILSSGTSRHTSPPKDLVAANPDWVKSTPWVSLGRVEPLADDAGEVAVDQRAVVQRLRAVSVTAATLESADKSAAKTKRGKKP